MAQQYQEKIIFQYSQVQANNNEFIWECPEYYTVLLNAVGLANTSGIAVTYRLFVNPSGGRTFTRNNALGWDIAIAADATDAWTGLTGVDFPTSFGIQCNTDDALVITAFGVEMKTG